MSRRMEIAQGAARSKAENTARATRVFTDARQQLVTLAGEADAALSEAEAALVEAAWTGPAAMQAVAIIGDLRNAATEAREALAAQ
jgi:hypothetical protein